MLSSFKNKKKSREDDTYVHYPKICKYLYKIQEDASSQCCSPKPEAEAVCSSKQALEDSLQKSVKKEIQVIKDLET